MNSRSAVLIRSKQQLFKAYFSLLKPRVMSLVVFTACVGMIVAPQGLSFGASLWALLAISLGAGGSGALNMWYDQDIDLLMSRTRNRALCSRQATPQNALILGLSLCIFSVFLLYKVSNLLSSFLLFFTIFFYVVIYTMILKRKTPQNIVIGGAAGAFPPMIGYSVQTGTITFESLILFAIIFFWTPPHFWMLALDRVEDYARAHVPMLPNVQGVEATHKQSLLYVLILWPVTLLPVVYSVWGAFYGVSVVLLNGLFTYSLLKYGRTLPKKVFAFSILYLFCVCVSIMVDVALRQIFP